MLIFLYKCSSVVTIDHSKHVSEQMRNCICVVYIAKLEVKNTFAKKQLPCIILILMGFADWLTTLVGVTYFGAAEINPLFAALTHSNLLAFSVIKLSATLLIGFLFYKAYQIEKTLGASCQLEKRFLQSGYFLSLTTLTAIVTNNVIAVVHVL
jgi:hypothetical protein